MELVYEKCFFNCTALKAASESEEYGACTFKLNERSIIFRVAKITPTKIGQFVTIWKRNTAGTIQPFDVLDEVDFIIISTRDNTNFGQFIFSKDILLAKGILADKNQKGKMAIRVYPPWDITLNAQAIKSQQWQLDYFLTISTNVAIDLNRAKQLCL